MSGASGRGSGFNFDDLSKRERIGLATKLYGGTPASGLAKGIAGLLGPSDFTAAFAGDAFMPAALGVKGTDSPGIGTRLGANLRDPKTAEGLLRGVATMGQIQQAERDRMSAMLANSKHPGYRGPPPKNTYLNPEMMVEIPGLGPVFTHDPRYQEYLKRRNGGMG